MKLLISALTKFIAGLVLVGLLLFLPAGSFSWPGGWRFVLLLFVPMLFFGLILYLKAPELLKKRLDAKEKQTEQKGVVAASALVFVAAFILAGLDYRFGWTSVPLWLIAVASVLMLLGYGLYMEVMRENAWLSRTVEVQQGQQLVSTGLYGLVRHPMYTATILLFLSMPLVLGSWISFVLLLFYPLVIIFRIKGEEEQLKKELAGYAEYTTKVRYRLLPFIW